MTEVADLTDVLGAAIAGALDKKGYKTLTAVQQAVLDPALAGRDLRVSSQTGSGKTLAIGFMIRSLVESPAPAPAKVRPVAQPRAIVVAPTRELAKQVALELRWLFAGFGVNVATATGGSSFRDEARGFAMNPAVVVGTPGRLLDCLNREAIDASQVGAVVLDEADRMLDLGFREDLEAILSRPPKGTRTHLVSATFAREVATLADRVQTNPARVEGTRLGVANVDIDHVIHLIAPNQRLDALINLLLSDPNAQTLVFVRMRVDVAQVSRELKNAGFLAAGLSGEMEQRERNQTLAEFKRGLLRVLVATDVAARGIDVPEVTRVIHAEPPTNADGYTHRSGRTGRAGRKGVSALLVTTGQMVPVTRILRQAGIKHRFEAVPTAADVQQQSDLRIVSELTAPTEDALDPRLHVLAEQILASTTPQESVARLLSRLPDVQRVAPRDITPIVPPSAQPPARRDRNVRDDRNAGPSRFDRNERFNGTDRNDRNAGREERPMREAPPARAAAAKPAQLKPAAAKPAQFKPAAAKPAAAKPPRGSVTNATRPVAAEGGRKPPPRAAAPQQDEWVPFRVTWGQEHGADARRLLAMVCRRGDVRSSDVGAIRIQRSFSVVNVNANVAQGFALATEKPDPRDPKVRIRLDARAD